MFHPTIQFTITAEAFLIAKIFGNKLMPESADVGFEMLHIHGIEAAYTYIVR